MDRRRALLAASMQSGGIDFGELPPESTEFGFPLYLNITELDYESSDSVEYVREGDEITALLWEWFDKNAVAIGSYASYIVLDETNRIYINGAPVTEMYEYFYGSEITLYVSDSVFDEVYLDELGLWGFIYK